MRYDPMDLERSEIEPVCRTNRTACVVSTIGGVSTGSFGLCPPTRNLPERCGRRLTIQAPDHRRQGLPSSKPFERSGRVVLEELKNNQDAAEKPDIRRQSWNVWSTQIRY